MFNQFFLKSICRMLFKRSFHMVSAVFFLSVAAVSGGTVTSTVSPSNSNPFLGANIDVTISVNMSAMESPNDKLGSFTGSLSWNAAVLTYVSNSGILSGFTGVVNPGSNHVTFSGINPTGVTGSFNILRITFSASGLGSSPLDLEYTAMVAALTFQDLISSLTINDSQVTVGQTTEYTLVLSVNPSGAGTTVPSIGSHSYAENTVVNVSATPNSGYQFNSWTGDVATPSSTSTTVTMTSDKSVTANFTTIQQGEVHSYATPSNSTPNVGETFAVTVSVDMGAMSTPNNKLGSFSGSLSWDSSILAYNSNSGVLSGFTGAVNAGSDHISFSGVNPTGTTGSVDLVTITFSGASAGSTSLDLDYSAMVSAVTFYDLLPYLTIHDGIVTVGQVEDVTLTMAVNPAGGGTTEPEMGAHDYPVETEVDIEATPNSGFYFSHWEGNVADVNDPTTMVIMDSDKTVTAHFTQNEDGEIHSYATPSDETVSLGDPVTVIISVDMSAATAPNDNLGSFTGSLSWDSSILAYSSDSDILSGFTGVVNVEDARISFNGANPAGVSGTFNVLTVTFDATTVGTSLLDLEYTAMAAAGTFQNLLPDLTIHDGQVNVGQVETVTLTMAVNPSGGGTTDPMAGDHDYPMGTEVDIEADANPGYVFNHWEGGVADVNDSATSITLNTNQTVTAYFIESGAEAVHAYTTPSPELISPGQTVDVTLSIDMSGMSAPDHALGSFTGMLVWDPSILSYTGNSGILSGFTGIVNPETGVVHFNGANPSGVEGVLDILQIRFSGTAEGISPLILAYSAMAAAGSFRDLIPVLVTHSDSVIVGALQEYTLTLYVNPVGSGSTVPPVGSYPYNEGTEVEIIANPNYGFLFKAWEGGVENPEDDTTTVIMDSDKTITALFGLINSVGDLLSAEQPDKLRLAQNFPNPFNPNTRLIFQIPDPGEVTIIVFNTMGQKVKSMLEGFMIPGTYQIEWDGTDDHGNRIGSGIYPIVLRTGSGSRAVKAFLMK